MSGISFYGALADGFKVTPIISAAAEQTRQYALKTIKEKTPVGVGTPKPGRLKAGWDVDLEGYGLRITNPVPYAPFVELGTKKMAGRHMLERSLPEIQGEFRRQLGVALGKKLATVITMGVEPQPLDYSNIAQEIRRKTGGFKLGAKPRRTTYRKRR